MSARARVLWGRGNVMGLLCWILLSDWDKWAEAKAREKGRLTLREQSRSRTAKYFSRRLRSSLFFCCCSRSFAAFSLTQFYFPSYFLMSLSLLFKTSHFFFLLSFSSFPPFFLHSLIHSTNIFVSSIYFVSMSYYLLCYYSKYWIYKGDQCKILTLEFSQWIYELYGCK